MKKFKRLFRKHRFDFFTMLHMEPKPIGIQRSVVAPGKQEKIYMMPFEIENEVFNSAGKYGGAQGSPRNVEEDSEEDEDEEYDYTLDTTGWGTTFKTSNYRTHLYLKDKGFDFEITNYQYVTLENVRELCQHGRIEISLMNGNIQNEDGSLYLYCEGHVMIITGVTRDCRYIVSTWGKKKYVDPNEVVEKDGKRTELYYKFLEVENRHIHV